MIAKIEIIELAGEWNLRPEVVEKDYVLVAHVAVPFAAAPRWNSANVCGEIAWALPDDQHSAIDFSMLDWTTCPAVERVAGRVSGEWLFRGTRVPVRALFENLEGGASVPEFLTWFPGVTREQVDAVLEHASRSLAVSA